MKNRFELCENYERMLDNVVGELVDYLKDHPSLESLVIGVSGGIDSALCCAIAREACDITGVKLIGRSITIETNTLDEQERAKVTGEAFCDDFKELNLSETFRSVWQDLDDDVEDISEHAYLVARGNVKARLRMIQLYHLAGMNNGMVLSTDNYTEYMLGFWTLHGDVGDYATIQAMWKTEVYGLAFWMQQNCYNVDEQGNPNPFKNYKNRAYALSICAGAVPTDGLGISESDLDQLGASCYNEVDDILFRYIVKKEVDLASHPVIVRMINSEFKRDRDYDEERKNLIK